MENKLPEGWEWKKLGEVFQLSSGKSRPELTSDIPDCDFIYPIYGGNGILGYSREYLIDEPTIVIGRVGQYCGSVYISEQKSWISDNALYAKKLLTDRINLKYLKLALFNIDLNKFQKKCGQPLINQSIVCNQSIPLPPLETQQKIVSILEKAEETKKLRAQADELTQKLLQSVFLEMFGDPVENPHGFEIEEIGDLVIATQYGTSKKANEDGKGIPVLRMNNITYEGNWDLSSIKYIELDQKEMEKYLVHKGELLFNRTNSKELVGKSAVYKEEKPMAFAGYLIKLITESPAVSEFIAGHLNSKYGKMYLQNMAKNIVGMANINAQEVQRIPIVLPSRETMEKYSAIVIQIEETRKSQTQSSIEINTLFDALMQKAFTGELVS